MALISEVRREKAEKKLSLNAPIKKLIVLAKDERAARAIKSGSGDIVGACKVEKFEVNIGKGEGREVAECPNLRFTAEY